MQSKLILKMLLQSEIDFNWILKAKIKTWCNIAILPYIYTIILCDILLQKSHKLASYVHFFLIEL